MSTLIRSSLAVIALAGAVPALAKDPPLKVTSGAAAKGQQSVVIGTFNIGFIFESVDRNGKQNQGGLMGAFGGTTKAKSKLVGVTPEMMQAITDAAYEDFKAQLAAQGYTVNDSTAMFASAELAKAKATPAPYAVTVMLEKNSKGESYYYKPTALSNQYFLPGDIMLGGGGMFSGFAAAGMSMQAGQVQSAIMNYAKATGQAVLGVTYLIDFSQAKRPGAFSFSSMKVNSGMAVVDEYSRLIMVTPNFKTTTVVIKQPVAVEGDFAAVADATKDKGAQAAANVAGGVAAVFGVGGFGVGKSRTYEFTVKPDQYQPGAVKAATVANALVVNQLAALK